MPAYSVAHPGDPAEYERYLEHFTELHGDRPRALLLLFEGNDFPDWMRPRREPGILDRLEREYHRYVHMFSRTGLFRVARAQLDRWQSRTAIRTNAGLLLEDTPAGRFAYYHSYVDATLRESYGPVPEYEAILQRMQPRLEAVFFIPTKYRVYQGALRPGQPLPSANFEYLAGVCRRLELPCIDLTPALTRRTLELLPDGCFTYWPDDTHWGPEGIAAAAAEVAAYLGALGAR